MRILLLAPHPFFQERGTPIAVRLLASVLTEAGHQVEMLCYHEGQDPALAGVAIHRIRPPRWVRGVPPGPSWQKALCDLYMWPAAKRLAASGRFDLVHAVEEAAFLARRLRRLYGLPYVYDMDSCLSQQMADKYPLAKPLAGLMARLEGGAVRASAGVVAVCRALEEVARAHDASTRVCRLEDISLLDQEPGPAPQERLEFGGPLVMYVGNLEPYQGIDLLLEGFALAAAQQPQAQMVVIGGGPSDVARYQARANSLGLAQRAHFLGPRPQAHLGHYLRQAAVLASPRIQGQNTPMKIYSYLDSGRPLLATRLPTHTQVLDDQIAMLVEPEPAELARGLAALLGDVELRERLAAAARQRVAEHYSLAAYRRKLLDFYRDLETRCLGEGA
ncbi:MAG: glycosyltransferase [Desulfarculus sp.]|nr:MAG: glycosyltransferase [Desulfarculus sp.]